MHKVKNVQKLLEPLLYVDILYLNILELNFYGIHNLLVKTICM